MAGSIASAYVCGLGVEHPLAKFVGAQFALGRGARRCLLEMEPRADVEADLRGPAQLGFENRQLLGRRSIRPGPASAISVSQKMLAVSANVEGAPRSSDGSPRWQ